MRGSARPPDFFITAPTNTPSSFFSPAQVALPFRRLRGDDLVDPRRELRLVADLSEPFALGDLLRTIAGLRHQREDALRRAVAHRAVAHHVEQRREIGRPHRESVDRHAGVLEDGQHLAHHPVRGGLRVAVRVRDGLEVVGDARARGEHIDVVRAEAGTRRRIAVVARREAPASRSRMLRDPVVR